jgi:hypothetical protein
MADAAFRDSQAAQVHDPHVFAVNSLCDTLMSQKPGSQVPYVAPHYNAARASILTLQSSPGPSSGGESGSGFVSWENDDPASARMSQIFTIVGLSDEHMLPWNVYPWHVPQEYPGGLPPHLVSEGVDALGQLIELHPNIRAIVAHGGDAKRSVRTLLSKKKFAAYTRQRDIRVWEARHPANRAFVLPKDERAVALEKLCQTYREAMTYVGLAEHDGPEEVDGDLATLEPTIARARFIKPVKLVTSGSELVAEVGDVLSGRTDGHTDDETRKLVRGYLSTMSAGRRTELLVELVTQRLNS